MMFLHKEYSRSIELSFEGWTWREKWTWIRQWNRSAREGNEIYHKQMQRGLFGLYRTVYHHGDPI